MWVFQVIIVEQHILELFSTFFLTFLTFFNFFQLLFQLFSTLFPTSPQFFLNFFSPFFNFQNWPLGGATYISCKFDQQVGLLASVANLAIRWPCLHQLQIWPPGGATCIATLPWIALLASSVCIELVSSSARVTSVKSTKCLSLTQCTMRLST